MTTFAAPMDGLAGLLAPSRSTARSKSAARIEEMREEIRRYLLESYFLRNAADKALSELEELRIEASQEGWDGYDAKPLLPEAYQKAWVFLNALPTSAPLPELTVDPDGEVALDWIFGKQRALTLSIGPTGRCSFAWMQGQRTSRGTEWIDDEVPASIAIALRQLDR